MSDLEGASMPKRIEPSVEELLTENLQLHEKIIVSAKEIEDLKNLLEVARSENLKAYKAYFDVSERLKAYERSEKVPLLKRLSNGK